MSTVAGAIKCVCVAIFVEMLTFLHGSTVQSLSDARVSRRLSRGRRSNLPNRCVQDIHIHLLNHFDSASYQDDWGAYHCPVDRRSATHAAIGTNPQLLPSRPRATTTPAPIFFLHFFFRILVPSSSVRLRILVTHLRSRCPIHPSSSNPRGAEGTHRIEVRLRAR